MNRLALALLAACAFLGLSLPAQAQPLPADLALDAFVLDFRQDGTHDPSGDRVAAAYATACAAGYALACAPEAWIGTGDFTKVVGAVDAACQEGDPVGCVVAGWAMTQLRPGRVDRELPSVDAGRDRFRASCDAGLPRGCTDLALLELALAGDSPDERDLAVARLKRACQAGEGRACHYVGRESQDLQRKVWWMEQGCQAGDPRSCTALATRLRIGNGVWEDDRRGLKLALDACEGGLGEACTVAGSMVEYGEGVDANPDQAVSSYQKACRLADPSGCTAVGARLVITSPLDSELYERGLDYLRKACDEGDGDGCWQMSERYLWSDLASRDLDEGRRWLERGCKAGSDLACASLGQALTFGVLGAPQPEAARDLLSQECIGEQGGLSCATLAWMVSSGTATHELIPQDLLQRACVADSGRGCHALGNLLLGDDEVSAKLRQAPEALAAYESGCRLRFRPSCDAAALVKRAINRRGAEVTAPGRRTGPVTAQEAIFGPIQDDGGIGAISAVLRGEVQGLPEATPRLRVSTCAMDKDYACAELVTRMLVPAEAQPEPRHKPTLAVACVQGVGRACGLLGDLARSAGQRVEAFSRYDEGCSTGDPVSCLEAGRILEKGLGVKADRSRAARAFVGGCAAAAPIEEACRSAERLVARGAKLAEDEPGRIHALAALCSPFSLASCWEAAQALEEGAVVPQDSVRAYRLARVACEGGLEAACPGEGLSDLAAMVGHGPPSLMGALRRGDVEGTAVSASALATYGACYQSALGRDPAAGGVVSVQVLVADDGHVASAKVLESSIEDQEFLGCLATTMRELRFPRHSSSTFAIVGQPLLFHPATTLAHVPGAWLALLPEEGDGTESLMQPLAKAGLGACLSPLDGVVPGTLDLELDLGADGIVVDARLLREASEGASFLGCVEARLEGAQLPPPAGGAAATVKSKVQLHTYVVEDLELDGAHEH